MGCPCEAVVYTGDEEAAEAVFRAMEHEVKRLDAKYSHYSEDSGLARLQCLAARAGGTDTDPETAVLLDYAAEQYRVSGGMFDVTVGALTSLWEGANTVPDANLIERALKRGGWHRVEWDRKTLRLPPGTKLNFGGVVKEYAADRAAWLAASRGVRHGYIDLGGDFHFLGGHPDGSSWQVGIRDPRQRERAIASVRMRRGGLASSGDYERFSEIDGRRYGHIIDARSGWPVDTDRPGSLAAVSVIAPSSLLAGSAATLAMLLQGDRARGFLADSGLAWLGIGRDGRTEGTLEAMEMNP